MPIIETTDTRPPHGAAAGGETRLQRRLHRRYNIYLPLSFLARDLKRNTLRGTGTTINIGAGGAFFACRERGLEPGMRLQIVLHVTSALIRAESIALTATILRVTSLGGGNGLQLGVAIRFDQAWNSIAILAPE